MRREKLIKGDIDYNTTHKVRRLHQAASVDLIKKCSFSVWLGICVVAKQNRWHISRFTNELAAQLAFRGLENHSCNVSTHKVDDGILSLFRHLNLQWLFLQKS
jgi:hypothetical protein